MARARNASVAFVLAAAATCSACGVPQFDVPTDSAGQPTVATIVERIQCEIRDMVRDDTTDPVAYHRLFLLDGDYDVEIQLSLEINQSGGLVPSVFWIDPLSKVTNLTFGGSATLSEGRDQKFTENIQLSARNIYSLWKTGTNPHDCPSADTNLSGALGLKDAVAMADLTSGLDASQTLSGKGVFGSAIQFVVTKNVTSLGPAWTLVHFKNSGGVTLSAMNTDGLLLSFAQGPNAGKRMSITQVIPPNPPNKKAHDYMQLMLTRSIDSQLNELLNQSH